MGSGWQLAQLDVAFLADPKFVRLARRVPDDETFAACVGVWTMCVAHAWAHDDPDVGQIISSYPAPAAWLAECGLLHGVELVGYGKRTEAVRRRREEDAARKRGERSASVQGTPQDSDGVRRSPRSGSGSGSGSGLDGAPRSVENTPRATAGGPKVTGLRLAAERRDG